MGRVCLDDSWSRRVGSPVRTTWRMRSYRTSQGEDWGRREPTTVLQQGVHVFCRASNGISHDDTICTVEDKVSSKISPGLRGEVVETLCPTFIRSNVCVCVFLTTLHVSRHGWLVRRSKVGYRLKLPQDRVKVEERRDPNRVDTFYKDLLDIPVWTTVDKVSSMYFPGLRLEVGEDRR